MLLSIAKIVKVNNLLTEIFKGIRESGLIKYTALLHEYSVGITYQCNELDKP